MNTNQPRVSGVPTPTPTPSLDTDWNCYSHWRLLVVDDYDRHYVVVGGQLFRWKTKFSKQHKNFKNNTFKHYQVFTRPPIPTRMDKREDLMQQLWHYFSALFTKWNKYWGVSEMWTGRILHNCKIFGWNSENLRVKDFILILPPQRVIYQGECTLGSQGARRCHQPSNRSQIVGGISVI